MFKVYLLVSDLDRSYYIGYSSDINSRLLYHNKGRVKSTKRKIPWGFVGCEEYETEREARWREYNLKHNANERYKFIEKLTKK